MPYVCASCGDTVVATRTLHPLAALERVRRLATTLVFPPWALVICLFRGFGVAPPGTVGFARGSSTLRVSVPLISPGWRWQNSCCSSFFPVLEFDAGVGRSRYWPQRVGEGTLCQATLLAQRPFAGVGDNTPALAAAPNRSAQEPGYQRAKL